MKDKNYGARSIRPEVKLHANKPCGLKKHFRGCFRQVLGYLDMLATDDEERFVWAGWKSILQHAQKWKEEERTYSRRQVFFWLREAQKLGIIEPAKRVRSGFVRSGFIVKSHATLASSLQERKACVLSLKPHCEQTQNALQLSPTAPETSVTAPLTALDLICNRTSNRTSSRTAKPAQTTVNKGDAGNNDEDFSDVLPEVSPPLSLSSLSSHPCKENPGKGNPVKSAERQNRITSHFDDLTKTEEQPGKEHDISIGDYFHLAYLSDREIVEVVSDGEFNLSCLEDYQYTEDLAEFCKRAIADCAKESFVGRFSCARVMGIAMASLREQYEADAPKGWLPVMKLLRKGGLMRIDREEASLSDEFWISPEEILTSPWSAMATSLLRTSWRLKESAEREPEFKALLIQMAVRLGVPKGWREALDYSSAVISELKRQNQLVPEPLLAIQVELELRVNGQELPASVERVA
jgi:hypothetical protein